MAKKLLEKAQRQEKTTKEMMENNASNKYEKIIVKLKVKESEYYILWGNDFSDFDNNKFLIDRDNKILCFSTISELFNFINNHIDIVFDLDKTLLWVEEFGSEDKITNMDFNIIYDFSNKVEIEEYVPQCANKCIDILNLISDYVQQIKDQKLIDIYFNENFQIVKDLLYLKYFWKSPSEQLDETYQRFKQDFDYKDFRNSLIILIEVFENALRLVK